MKKSKPLVSVIMPAYNAEQHIDDAIQSILHQTLRNFELIIVNDSSTDNTRKIVEKYIKKDPRVNVINNKTSRNIANVLNKGISVAQSNIIARMDADDISLPHRLERQYKIITSRENIAVVGANVMIIDFSGNYKGERKYPDSAQELRSCLFRYSPFAHPVVMFKKNLYEQVGGYNPKYSPTEDLDLWFKLGEKNEFASISEPLLKYRVYEKSSSHQVLRNLEMMVFEIRMNAITKRGYRPSLYDIGYNLLQFVTLWVMPVKYRIKLYNLLRNNDLI